MSRLEVFALVPLMLASLYAQDAPKPPAPPTPTPNPTATPSPTPTAPSANRVAPTTPAVAPTTPASTQPPGGNRAFGIFPNYRTADWSQRGTVLSNRQKLSIAARDSFDYPTVLLAAAVAGIGQWNNSNPSFGQGAQGYGHRWITSYGDQAIGNMLTEGVFPVLLNEDPRYFRRGTGSTWRRLGYAVTRVVITQRDGGGSRFNGSEWLGSATTVGIGNAYYPDSRTLGGNASRLFTLVGIDAASMVLKEFWPDIQRKFHK